MSNTADMILERWVASLPSKSKKHEDVLNNFCELFSEMHDADIDLETAHSLIGKATQAHYPSEYIARFVYDRSRFKKTTSFQDFLKKWKDDTDEKAKQAFYSYYELEHDKKPREAVKTEKTFGNMSPQEYKLQRERAESFPALDIAEIQKRMSQYDGSLTFDGGDDE